MPITTDPTDRETGLVFRSAEGVRPQVHALVIGVGVFSSTNLPLLTSTCVSAKEMAGWFLDGALNRKADGFHNKKIPLGTIRLLLSENSGAQSSTYEGAPVPRARFDKVKAAVRAWLQDCRSHSDNISFLFLSSHGESFGRRTAFLLEDFGEDPDDITAGMSEVEQFVESVSNIESKDKLLIFDCCRTATGLGLRFDQEFGSRLVNLPASSVGRSTQPHVLRSTSLGDEAFGEKNQPTIFAQALLEALRGLAASPNDKWSIDTHNLFRVTSRLCGLHSSRGQPLQAPESQMAMPFVICSAQATELSEIFITLPPGYSLEDTRIQIFNADAAPLELEWKGRSYVRTSLIAQKPHTISAINADGIRIGDTHLTPYPPVAFSTVPELTSEVRTLPEPKGFSKRTGLAQLTVCISTHDPTGAAGSIVELTPLFDSPNNSARRVAPPDGRLNFELSPGTYLVSISSHSGPTVTSQIELREHVCSEIEFRIPLDSSRAPEARPPSDSLDVLSESSDQYSERSTSRRLPWGGIGVRVRNVDSPLLGAGFITTSQISFDVQSTSTALELVDSCIQRFPIRSNQLYSTNGDDLLPWIAIDRPAWGREILAIPSLGRAGKYLYGHNDVLDPWNVEICDGDRGLDYESMTFARVTSSQWTPLLGFLGRRDFRNAGLIIDDILSNETVRSAIIEKLENPIAAIACALAAVAAGRVPSYGIDETWIRGLVTSFPGLADGPIILARLLTNISGDITGTNIEATDFIHLAAFRTAPLFSLSLDWLVAGLATTKSPATSRSSVDWQLIKSDFLRLAQRSDPNRVFTVIRYPEFDHDV